MAVWLSGNQPQDELLRQGYPWGAAFREAGGKEDIGKIFSGRRAFLQITLPIWLTIRTRIWLTPIPSIMNNFPPGPVLPAENLLVSVTWVQLYRQGSRELWHQPPGADLAGRS